MECLLLNSNNTTKTNVKSINNCTSTGFRTRKQLLVKKKQQKSLYNQLMIRKERHIKKEISVSSFNDVLLEANKKQHGHVGQLKIAEKERMKEALKGHLEPATRKRNVPFFIQNNFFM